MQANSPHLEPMRLHEYLSLESATGFLTWKERPVEHFKSAQSCRRWNARFAGKRAGRKTARGYRAVSIDLWVYYEHRVVWAMTHGVWPKNQIDHLNRDRSDNRPENLRDCTASENLKNRSGWRRKS